MIKITTWNIRGLTKPTLPFHHLKNYDIIFLQETFLNSPDKIATVAGKWTGYHKGRTHKHAFSPSISEHSCGTAILVNPHNSATLNQHHPNNITYPLLTHRSTWATITGLDHLPPNTLLVSLYLPNIPREREQMWTQVSHYINTTHPNANIILAGDFNDTRTSLERLPPRQPHGDDIQEVILNHRLCDPARLTEGTAPLYTWRCPPRAARLDYILLSTNILEKFHSTSYSSTPIKNWDHDLVTISLHPNKKNTTPPFRITNAHMEKEEIHNLIVHTLTSALTQVQTDPAQAPTILSNIHTTLASSISRKWKSIQHKANLTKTRRLNRLKSIELRLPTLSPPQSPQDLIDTHTLTRQHSTITKQIRDEELSKLNDAHQHYVRNWNRDGGTPSRRFCRLETPPRALQRIPPLRDHLNNLAETDEENLTFAKTFYATLYRADNSLPETNLDTGVDNILQQFNRAISPESRTLLEAPIQQEEILATIKRLPKNKAPGPDGFSNEFYIKYRNLISPLLVATIQQIKESGHCPSFLKSATITLIHKKNAKDDLGNYRPISLLSCAAKIITGTITQRLYAVADEIITPLQNGFLPYRNIQDSFLNLRSAIESGENGYVALLDFAKAFDKMSHRFLKKILLKLGFPRSIIDLIYSLWADSQGRVLINGRLSEPFQISRGVRQGDPISPILYVIASIPLAHRLSLTLPGISKSSVKWLLSLYADDTSVILSSPRQIHILRDEIDFFCSLSTMKINWTKSLVFGFGLYINRPIPNAGMQWLTPDRTATYLGLQISGNLQLADKRSWEATLLKVQRRADQWSLRTLNWLDKRTVVIYMLAAIVWYRVPLILTKNSQINSLSKILAKFFCPNKQISWSTLTRPWNEGGFQLPDIPMKIRKLQGKLASRIYSGRSQPWKLLWKHAIQHTAKHKDPRILPHPLLEPHREPRNNQNPWASTPQRPLQITYPLLRLSPLARQSLTHLQDYTHIKSHPNSQLTIDQILPIPAAPNKILDTHANSHQLRRLIASNHFRITDLFNEDTRQFFTPEELSLPTGIPPNTLTPLLSSIRRYLPPPWLRTLTLSNRTFTPGDWVLLENADPQLARHHLFQIDTIEENSAVLKWATPDHHIHLDNLYWLVPDQTEVQPLGALSHARVESITLPSGRTAVLFHAEEETAPYPHSTTLTQTRRLPQAPSPLNWPHLNPNIYWSLFHILCKSKSDARALKTLYLLLHKKLWTSERKCRIFRPPPDPFSCPLCPQSDIPETSEHIPTCPISLNILREATEDRTHVNLLLSLQGSINRQLPSPTTHIILETLQWSWNRRCRILYDDPPPSRPTQPEIDTLVRTLRHKYPP